MDAARAAIGGELERFAVNTLEYIQREAKLTFEPIELPPIKTQVPRAARARRGARPRLPHRPRRAAPVHPRVPARADRRRRRRRRAARDAASKPDIIIGDFDSVSERGARRPAPSSSTTCTSTGARPAARTCRPGASRTTSSSSTARARTSPCCWPTRPARSSSSPSARTRRWSSSSTRAAAACRRRSSPGSGSARSLVDAKGVSRLYEGRVRRRDMALLVASALLAMIVVSIVSEPIHVFLRGIGLTLEDLWFSITDTF